MISRCYNSKDVHYNFYGGRGIVVCDRWLGSDGPIRFVSDMGGPPMGLTLDRKNNEGPYSPENCRWATRKEQANNTRGMKQVTLNGQTKNIKQWLSVVGLSQGRFYKRMSDGWGFVDALTTPPKTYMRVTFKGKSYTIKEWSRELGVSRTTIHKWLSNGL
jgi:predicted DNA-binding transcriptional regulator AlpA